MERSMPWGIGEREEAFFHGVHKFNGKPFEFADSLVRVK